MGRIVPYGFTKRKGGDLVPRVGMPEFTWDFPPDFVLVIDTREQTPLFLQRPPKGLTIVRDTLPIGDYSIRGLEDRIVVERKTVDDLLTSVTVVHEEFKQRMIAMSRYERKWLLIEGLESDYLSWQPHRKIHPNQVRCAVASIEAVIGVPVHCSESREMCERWMLDVFLRYYREVKGDGNTI